MNIRSWAKKACTGCGLEKAAEHFGVLKKAKDGRNTRCLACAAAYARLFYHSHPEYIASKRAARTSAAAARYHRDPERFRAIAKARRERNIERSRATERDTKRREYQRRSEVLITRCKRYAKENRDKIRERLSAPHRRLHGNMSRAIRASLRAGKDGRAWESLAGYSRAELMAHLEAKFSTGMSFDNYGLWEIDHIRPRASFSYATPADPEFRECWALENLQPLWRADNRRKWAHEAGAA
jgi:hypothetical protein